MKKQSVLVFAAHPDDEVLGCGATIALHARRGDGVHVVILAEGATSRDKHRDRTKRNADISKLAEAAHRAKTVLGVSSLALHDYPDNRMDSMDLLDVIKVIERHVADKKPSIVYTHHAGDLNIDHRIVHEAVMTACRPIPGGQVNSILFFETPSSTEWQAPGPATAFVPNWFVDVSSTLDLKLKALKAYRSEMRAWPHARSLEAVTHLARWRGATIGVQAAEAFVLGKHLVKGEDR